MPPTGIEPALPKKRDFESRASTNSARGAKGTEPYSGSAADYSPAIAAVNTKSQIIPITSFTDPICRFKDVASSFYRYQFDDSKTV